MDNRSFKENDTVKLNASNRKKMFIKVSESFGVFMIRNLTFTIVLYFLPSIVINYSIVCLL